MKNMKIEAIHNFHDEIFSEKWASEFSPSPEKMDLFETIVEYIKSEQRNSIDILELGIGPGYLAKFLLENFENISYEGLDFSEPMLKIASRRNIENKDRIVFTQVDLTEDNWTDKLKTKPEIVVSTWALHDLLAKENISNVYINAYKLLPINGILINGDFVKPVGSKFEYEAGRITIEEHLELLKLAGFNSVTCLKEFEKSVENPTTANNYACIVAKK